MTRSSYRSPLNLSNSVDYDAIKKNGFHDQGLLVVDINDDRISWVEREVLRQVGEKLYGKSKKAG